MGKNNKSYRIRTTVNQDAVVHVNFDQTFEKFEILSLTLDQTNAYRLMASNTGVVAGRVLANGGFGVPNAKVSVFVPYDGTEDMRHRLLYQFTTPQDTYGATIKYNLLPSESDDACHQNVGTFPTKRIVLDNQDWVEIFDKYYKYTTKTNNAGDYMIYGVPVGMQQIHMDVDLSDIGILSQTPRDMMYKGYSANLFDSPTKFKKDTNLTSLVQIMSKDNSVYVYPFWGDTTNTSTNAAITRCDFNLDYKFEPTCIFMGSVITDTGENSLSKRCVAAKGQGKMSELVTGEGRIEMIRKTYDGKVEQYSVQGDKVINENGVWCYQIPMNLDYIITDEFGNMVLSDNPDKGIPTRTRVRFRVNMADSPGDMIARKRARYLIPNNPHLCSGTDDSYPDFTSTKLIDYEFGSRTKNENFRDLMWNNVYTVKNYIPRLQKSRLPNNLRHLGIKMVNHSGDNNPMPFNNLRIKFNFTYMFLCTLMKIIVMLTSFVNRIIGGISLGFYKAGVKCVELSLTSNLEVVRKIFAKRRKYINGDWKWKSEKRMESEVDGATPEDEPSELAAEISIEYYLGSLCKNEVKAWDFNTAKGDYKYQIGGLGAIFFVIVYSIHCGIKLSNICENDEGDVYSIAPGLPEELITVWHDVAMATEYKCGECSNATIAQVYNCIENQLAQENEVTSFNFYNDWVNGVLYFPLWYRRIKPERKILGVKWKAKDQYCANDNTLMPKGKYKKKLKLYNTMVPRRTFISNSGDNMGSIEALEDDSGTILGSSQDPNTGIETLTFKEQTEKNCYGYRCHKYSRTYQHVRTGIIYEKETMLGDRVQYYKPVYYDMNGNKDTITLYATDIVLLGSLNSCDIYGIPQFFKALSSTTYNMPPDLLVEDYDNNESDEGGVNDGSSENEKDTEKKINQVSEFTGADWGDLGCDQGAQGDNYNTTQYDAGGLFYGLTCFKHYTKPKSCINLSRICELGVSLDESQDIIDMDAINSATEPLTEDKIDDNYTKRLTPDGFVSYDEIYDMDYRSMFATLNGNFLKTKYNPNTGRIEYDFNHLYVDNFDGSLFKIMSSSAVRDGKMGHPETGVCNEHNGGHPNYRDNYNLEKSSDAYLNFRYGNYEKQVNFADTHNKKIYFYEHDHKVGGWSGVTAGLRQPRYENSFYFYFGLKEGSTALDKFNTEYFSDCVTESNIVPAYDITFNGNSWCQELIEIRDGYIAFNVYMDTPISITLINRDHPDIVYYINNVTKEKFYIGSTENAPNGYSHYPWYDVQNISHLNECIPNSTYDIVITDGNGNEYTDDITFEAPRVNFIADPHAFTCKNGELENRFAVLDSSNQIDWTQTFAAIANQGGIDTQIQEVVRDIGGYIIVRNIDADVSNFKIELRPVNSTFFGDTYNGCDVIVTNSIPISSGSGYLGYNETRREYYFGVPYGTQQYEITITQRCETETDIYEDSGNSTKIVVLVSEMLFNMYINGIDYDNIRNFRSGWNENGVSYISLENMTYGGNLYGWDDVDNIGHYYYNNSAHPIDTLEISTDLEIIKNTAIALGDDYDGNGASYIWSGVDCSTPYTWTADYCINSDWWGEITNAWGDGAYPQISCIHTVDQTQDTVYLMRRIIIELDSYVRTDYETIDTHEVIVTEDINGSLNYLDNAYSDFQGLTTKEILDVIAELNRVVEMRKEFSKQLQGALRIGKENTQLRVTYRSNEPPVKYLVIGRVDVPNSNPTQDPTLGVKFILDAGLEENETVFYLPTLMKTLVNDVWVYTPYMDNNNNYKYPYYVAIKDNNNIALPSASISEGINNFDNEQSGYPDQVRIDKLFGVHFLNKPLYLSFVRVWHPLNDIPLYMDGGNTTLTDPQYINMNGFAAGYCCNSLSHHPNIVKNNFSVAVTEQSTIEDSEIRQLIYCGNGTNDAIYGEYVYNSNYTPTYQYTQIENGSNSFTSNDGYGNSYTQYLDSNAITFEGTKFLHSHKYYIDDPDELHLSLTNPDNIRGNIAVYSYVKAGDESVDEYTLLYPLDELQSIAGQYRYTTLPQIYEPNTRLDVCDLYSTETSWSNRVDYKTEQQFPCNLDIRNYPPTGKFFAVVEYENENGNNRLISPIFETVGLRSIANIDYNNFGTSFTPYKQDIYITPRIKTYKSPDATDQDHFKMVGDNDIADIHELKNLVNYPFTFEIRDGESVLYSQNINILEPDTNVVSIENKWYTDWNGSSGTDRTGYTVSWNIVSIKVTVPPTTPIDLVAGQRVWITDITGIQYCCAFTQDGTISTEDELINNSHWSFTEETVNYVN